MPRLENGKEALQLIVDWTKWVVTVEAGMITIVGTFWTKDLGDSSKASSVALTFAFVCFFVSIMFAGIILIAAPAIVQRLDQIPEGEDVYCSGTYKGTEGMRLYTVTRFMLYAGAAGSLLLMLAVLLNLFSPTSHSQPIKKVAQDVTVKKDGPTAARSSTITSAIRKST